MSVKYCDIVNLRLVKCEGFHTLTLGFIPKGQGQDGYGKKIHTEYEVQLRGEGERWYKVYASCFSNVACFYTSRGYCHDWELQEHRDRARDLVKKAVKA